jgi:hypothetical protein
VLFRSRRNLSGGFLVAEINVGAPGNFLYDNSLR